MAKGIQSKRITDELLVHSNEEQGRADDIAERIVQLGGEPDLAPDGMVIRSMLEGILAVEEERADEMAHLLEDLPAELKQKKGAPIL